MVGADRGAQELVQTNLRMIRRSRPKLTEGDIFAMQLPDETYLFGRVVGADMPRHRDPMEGSVLIYVYKYRSVSKTPDLKELRPDNLLVPPLFTNQLGWTKGYFENQLHLELNPKDLAVHCFWDNFRQRYRDWDGATLDEPGPMCGKFALVSYRYVDDLVSDALGITRVSVEPGD